jgi:hypothetical protein
MEQLRKMWDEFIGNLNKKGIPVPMIRDPKTGLGSVSLTLMFFAFNVWLVSIIGKAAGSLGGMDPNQTMQMFMVCAGLYFGRKFQKDAKGVTMEGSEKEGEDK